MELDGKVVIITGAGTGIGRALTHRLLREGAFVVLSGRRREKLEETIAASGHAERALAVPGDVAKYGDLRRLVDTATRWQGQIDVVINNAGVAYGGSVEDLSPEEVEQTVRVNLLGPMWLVLLTLPALKQRPAGLIVNVGSMSGLVALPFQAAYVASKFGMNGFDQSLRRELRGTKVGLLSVFPGAIDSEMPSVEGKSRMKELGAGTLKTPEWIANLILKAMRENKSRLVGAVWKERMLPAMEFFAPGLITRQLDRLAGPLRSIMLDNTRWTRTKNALPPVE